MPTPEFKYFDPYPLGEDKTRYYLLTKDYVTTSVFDGQEVLNIKPEGLTLLAQVAFREVSFKLRTEHLEQMGAILTDFDASENDKFVALTMLKNAEISAKGVLPFCQDTGTATVFAKKGQSVWTGANDAEAISLGVYKTYTQENLRYSQTIPLDMYTEKNSGTNLPAQIDITATCGDDYQFLFVAKGGGSANKTMLFQETKALLNPD
ncbi:MAG TPA: fumarate hydratase, partial [Tenuifilaceae bacterium]|nr:fumarate hydratase [Tenuifilaceae bacterium]